MGEREQRGRERAAGNNIQVLCKKKKILVYKCNKCSESKKSLEKRNIQGKYTYLKNLLKKHTKYLYFVCFPPLTVTNNLFSPPPQDILNHLLGDIEIFVGQLSAAAAQSAKKKKKKKKCD